MQQFVISNTQYNLHVGIERRYKFIFKYRLIFHYVYVQNIIYVYNHNNKFLCMLPLEYKL